MKRIPEPKGDPKAPLQALIFDSIFNSFRGIITLCKVVNGSISKGDKVKFVQTGQEYTADEVGVLKMDMIPCPKLGTGEVGYIISGIKDATEVKVGDTITHVDTPCKEAIEGFQEVKPMVFAGVYPIDPNDYENLRTSLEKLQLNDASLTSPARELAGFGIRFPLRIPRTAAHGNRSGEARQGVQYGCHYNSAERVVQSLRQAWQL